jgi:U3 small nucleolar RNA-associated protein 25
MTNTYVYIYVNVTLFFFQATNQNQDAGNESNMTVTVLYSKYDVQQLAAIVGMDRAARMVSSERNVHMFVTGE